MCNKQLTNEYHCSSYLTLLFIQKDTPLSLLQPATTFHTMYHLLPLLAPSHHSTPRSPQSSILNPQSSLKSELEQHDVSVIGRLALLSLSLVFLVMCSQSPEVKIISRRQGNNIVRIDNTIIKAYSTYSRY